MGNKIKVNRVFVFLELVGFGGMLVFASLWVAGVPGDWEPYTVLSSLLGLASELLRRRAPQSSVGRFRNSSERIQHREKLRKEFEAELHNCRTKNLRQDAIIREVARVDSYPELDENEKGISPWFKVALLDTYEKGIVVCLGLGGLMNHPDGYRYVDRVNGEKPDIKAWHMADIPYDSIEAVNMEGDKYYYFPHIYCHFDFSGEPYERLWFAEEVEKSNGYPWYKELAIEKDVKQNSPSEGTLYFT